MPGCILQMPTKRYIKLSLLLYVFHSTNQFRYRVEAVTSNFWRGFIFIKLNAHPYPLYATKTVCYTFSMDEVQQPQTATALPSSSLTEIQVLENKVNQSVIPSDLRAKVTNMIERGKNSMRYAGVFNGIEQVSNYIDWVTSLPWNRRSDDTYDMAKAAQILDKNHYGMQEIKERILEYMSVLKLMKDEAGGDAEKTASMIHAPILFFVGLVGIGKTSLAISIGEAMGRQVIRIPCGGLGSALDLRGQSRLHPDAEPGLIIKALRRAGTKNPVIIFDELDRVTEEARADIMGVLLEIMDPEQNASFIDHYIDYPFNLSETLFIATANNTQNISAAVLDRFEPIRMPSYSDDEKIKIGKDYVLPKILASSGLKPTQLSITEETWPLIVRPLGFDSGMRTLERTITGICRKVARLIVEGKATQIAISPENVKQFLYTDVNMY